jgi:DNA-binding response OmpR family regulator
MPASLPVVLIVEDEPELREVLEETLQHAGYLTRVAGDGEVALAYLHAFPAEIGLVLLDLAMPVLDGYGLLKRMVSEHIELPVIVMSASRDPILPPGIPRLQKPFTAAALVAAIGAACGPLAA